MFEKNQILYMRFQCIDMYGCPKLLDMQWFSFFVEALDDAFLLITRFVAHLNLRQQVQYRID